MTVYVIFNPNEEMVEICRYAPLALAWVSGAVKGSYHVSRDAYNVYVHTNEGTYIITQWNVLE